MNIKSSFLTSFASPPKLPSSRKPEEFLGHIFNMQENDASPLLSALSGGFIQAFSPFSFDIRSMDCYLLLHTVSGCGKLVVNNEVYTLSPGSLVFLDCHSRFRLNIAIAPWEYQVFFITGQLLSYYYSLLPEGKISVISISGYSDISLNLEKLSAWCQKTSLTASLMVSSLLTEILTDYLSVILKETLHPPSEISGYLKEISLLFDNFFQETYTLDELAERFHVSKFKICREFGKAFGLPPLQYLNRRRIEIAKHLLQTTDYHVHTIGSMVGIENTNHFITLFKKFTGITPLEYKQGL